MSCFFGHDFSKWEIIEKGNLQKPRDDGNGMSIIGYSIFQRRKCKRCGYEELNSQSRYI
jgi:hypothetical protein